MIYIYIIVNYFNIYDVIKSIKSIGPVFFTYVNIYQSLLFLFVQETHIGTAT